MMSRITSHTSLVPAKVLLIYRDRLSDEDSDELRALIEQLRKFGAAHVALAASVPEEVQHKFSNDPYVTLGSRVRREVGELQEFHTVDRALDGAGRGAALVLPPARKGIYREQASRVSVAGRWWPTLETAVVNRLGQPVIDKPFRIRFRGGAGSLPHITWDSAGVPSLVPELVAGRAVLIGRRRDPTQPGISTPTTGLYDTMSPLEFHGQALNTLLTTSQVKDAPASIDWLFYVLASIAGGSLFERARARGCVILLVVLLAINAAVGLFVLRFFNSWLPIVEIATVQLICFARTAQNRNAFTELAWRELVEDLTAKLRQRRWPTGFFTAAEPWSQIVSFVRQTLNLQRVIILELPAKEYHVQEVKALNCSVSDIAEQRRDSRRWPYALAVEAKQPLRLSGDRPFLKVAHAEQQYLVPLLFAGELFGFVAVGVMRDKIDGLAEFEHRLGDFADQIAELLYRRRRVLAEQGQTGVWSRLFTTSPETRIYGELIHATHLLERRIERLESMFDKSPTAAAIYDLFGRLTMVNSRMSRLLQNEGVVASDLTTIDLVATLTQQGHDAARRFLRRVITSKRVESIPVTLKAQKGDYALRVRPMELEVPHAAVSANTPTPLHLLGILCELVDRTDVAQHYRLKEQLAESFGTTLRKDLAAVEEAATAIVDDTLPAAQRREYGTLIHGKVEQAVATLQECERLVVAELNGDHDGSLQIDPVPAIEEATATVQEVASERGITINVVRSPLASRVIAAPILLPGIFDTVLEFLLLDARDNSEIMIEFGESAAEVFVTCRNDGFGAMLEAVRAVLYQSGETNVAEHQRLRESLESMRSWGGQMSVASEVGRGTSVKLVFRKFQ
jgi:hypothetical protein